ncbi:MAG TPA: glycosyltransferase [Phnomibacter sp.]|nr:glycosyltransferase [Phnomibacter sp.]
MNLLCVGPLWRGSNAGGLFKALSRQGARIEVVDEFYYLSLRGFSKFSKALYKLIRPYQINDFNDEICRQIKNFKPNILLVYKGAFVQPRTLELAKANGVRLVNFYPDVSMFSHGKLLPQTMHYYELVFTNKTFGIKDLHDAFGVSNAIFVPHGFDPDIHRPLQLTAQEWEMYGCDASFIGTWSPKKEMLFSHLKSQLPQLNLHVWGSQWENSHSSVLKSCIKGREILGDLFAVAIQASKINLGILSERVQGASSGDLITSRTFHIPGAGGFLLHERNEESVLYFDENEEAGFFENEHELVDRVSYFLNNEEDRLRIAQNGHQRALRDHSLDRRAQVVMNAMLHQFRQ